MSCLINVIMGLLYSNTGNIGQNPYQKIKEFDFILLIGIFYSQFICFYNYLALLLAII